MPLDVDVNKSVMQNTLASWQPFALIFMMLYRTRGACDAALFRKRTSGLAD